MNPKVLSKMSYGMYVVGSGLDGEDNAMIANAALQVTSKAKTVAVIINKELRTHSFITKSGHFSLSVLNKETPNDFIRRLGFSAGKSDEKMAGLSVRRHGSLPVILDHACAYMTAKVIGHLDVLTHTIFVGEVLEAEVIDESEPLTYEDYRKNKGATPITAPTFNIEKLRKE